MYSIPQTLQTALANKTPQRVLIEFTKKPNGTAYSPVVQYSNEDILSSHGVELNETFQSEEDFEIGGTPSAELMFTMVNDSGQLKNFQFGTFTAWLGARIDSGTPGQNTKTKTFTEDGVTRTYQFTPLGTFVAERPNIVSTKTISVDAYDQMTLFEVDMPSDSALNLSWPSTLSNLFVKMCNYVGVNYVSSTFTNSTLSVASRPSAFSDATMRDVLGWIAEAAGAVAKFNRDGKLGMAWFNTVDKTYNESSYSDFTPYRYETKAVSKLSVRKGSSEHVTGSGSNAYLIKDNPFIGTNTNTAESNIYNKLNSAPTFHPASASLFTDWNIEAGDVVTVTNDGTNYSMPMYNVRLSWSGDTKVEAESTGNEKRESLPALEKKYYGSYGSLASAKQSEDWYVAVSDDVNSVRADLVVTASTIMGEVTTIRGEYALFQVEANQIREAVGRMEGDYAEFILEANQLRSRVEGAEGNATEAMQTANGLYATVSTIHGEVLELQATSSGLFARVTTAEGDIGDLQFSANSFRAAIETADSRLAALEVATSGISLAVGRKTTTYRQWYDPRSAAGGSHDVIVGDRWIKTKGTDTWGDVALLTWDDANDMQWHNAAGPLEYVWTGDATGWRLVTDYGTDLIVGAQLNVLDDRIQGIVRDVDNNYSKIEQTASYIRAIVADNKTGLSSMILQEASQIRAEVTDEVNSIQSSIQINADRIGLIVDDQSNQVKASVIVGIVNGSSQISLSASRIKFDGTTSVAGCFSVTNGVLYVEKEAIFRSSVSLYNNGRLSAGTLRVMGGENEYYDLTATKVSNLVADLRITTSGNSYVLQKKIIHDLSDSGWVDVGSFNRASALVGAWDGSTYTVSATGATPVHTTVYQKPEGNGQGANFSVMVYKDNPNVSANCIIRGDVWLVEDSTNKRVYAKWDNADSPTNWATVSTVDTYENGRQAGLDAAVSLSESWNLNTSTYYVTASPSGKYKSTKIFLVPDGNGTSNSFSVYATHTAGTTSAAKVATNYVYLTEDSTAKYAYAQWGSSTGTRMARVSTSETYNAGKDAVTMTGAWEIIGANNACRSVTMDNGKPANTAYIHMTGSKADPSANPTDNFPVWVYYGANTSNCLIRHSIYLTEVASSARSGCRVNAKWDDPSTGSIHGRIETGATWDAGASAVTLTGAWGTGASANTYTVTGSAPNNKTRSVTVHAYATGSGSDKNFSVQTYYGSSVNNVVDTKYVYLYENVSSKRIEAYYNQPQGTTGAVKVAQISASSIYNSVTLSGAWGTGNNANRYTVTPSNTADPVSTTVGLAAAGQQDTATVVAYHGSSSTNTVTSQHIYLVTTVSSTKANNTAAIRWANSTSSTYNIASVSLGDVWQAGYDSGSTISYDDIQLGNRGRWGTTEPTQSSSVVRVASGENNFGIPNNDFGYYKFTITVRGKQKMYYFAYDTR